MSKTLDVSFYVSLILERCEKSGWLLRAAGAVHGSRVDPVLCLLSTHARRRGRAKDGIYSGPACTAGYGAALLITSQW